MGAEPQKQACVHWWWEPQKGGRDWSGVPGAVEEKACSRQMLLSSRLARTPVFRFAMDRKAWESTQRGKGEAAAASGTSLDGWLAKLAVHFTAGWLHGRIVAIRGGTVPLYAAG